MQNGRTLLFDVDGVLVHGMHAREDRQRRWDTHLRQDLGVESVEFVERFIKQGFGGVIDGRKSLINELEEILPELGYTGSPLNFAAYWIHRDNQLNQPLLAGIRRLQASGAVGKLFIATNQEHLRAFHLWSNLGLQHIFDDMFYAARLGVSKPDPAFFAAIAARIGPQDEPPLMFDDSEAVVAAARDFGWDAARYDDIDDFTDHPWVAQQIEG